MKKLFAGAALTASLALLSTAAYADGVPRRAAAAAPSSSCCCSSGHNWSGFYAGVQVGEADYRSHTTADLAIPLIGGTTFDQDDGFLVGGVIGFNRQTCMAVWGIEADWSWTDVGRSRDSSSGLGSTFNFRNEMNSFGTIRTRAGIAVDNLLLFITGGIAFADVDHRFRDNSGSINGYNDSDVRWGWVAGFGTEYAIRDNISLRSDVLYASFDDKSHDVDLGGTNVHFRTFDEVWTVRTALNFKFGGDRHMEAAPLK